jgi:hypothetical protein
VLPGGLAAIAYSGDCVNGGITCKASATYAGDANHTSSNAIASITITYKVCTTTSEEGDDQKGNKNDESGGNGGESGNSLTAKVRVCNAQGRSINSPLLVVKAVSVSPTGALTPLSKSNPANLFRLDDDAYTYNLITKGFATGNYTLNYTIGNDPTVYHRGGRTN